MLRKFGYIFIFCAVGVWLLPVIGLTIKGIGDLSGNDKLIASLVLGALGVILLLVDTKIHK